jgi:hypothetical protein
LLITTRLHELLEAADLAELVTNQDAIEGLDLLAGQLQHDGVRAEQVEPR